MIFVSAEKTSYFRKKMKEEKTTKKICSVSASVLIVSEIDWFLRKTGVLDP